MSSVPPEFIAASYAFSRSSESDISSFGIVLIMVGMGIAISQLTVMEEPTPEPKNKANAERPFGWIHADHRVPLPSIEELATACHLVGQHGGHEMFLCVEGQGADLNKCEPSSDFSAYYGTPVFVCQGGTALPRYKQDLTSP
eukprot:CAMPEP_0184387400 /NCGR_PEP_ID=MMETSP0007-20130409/10701_1 /TAXON_ID=97485 /ORGANISM="Prymnesium parvum, Strain Texoma1" /LENGTH=141 /DNA_ID=CAMNT_0026735763 /DNA_START=71 /DNA_END=496 /DNA_ORIENTATION=+